MTLDEWVDLVCSELGLVRPDVTALLDLARDVAHGVARPAAPVTALLVGLAATGTADLPALMAQVTALIPTAPETPEGSEA